MYLYQLQDAQLHVLDILMKKITSSNTDAIDFISVNQKNSENLSKEMEKASKELDYEKAAVARDRIKALTQIQTSQKKTK